jgi:hypothetical protein
MAESEVFVWVASELESRTALSRLEARGTVRLVLKDAGLDPNSVAAFQMDVVLKRLMPAALTKRKVEDAAELCAALAAALKDSGAGRSEAVETAYDVFRRLDGRGGGGA